MAQPLAYGQIGQVYPLLQLVGDRCSARQWELFAAAAIREMARPPIGIMAVQDERGYVQGIFRYRAAHDPAGLPALFVNDLVAISMFNRFLGEAIDRVLTELARDHACRVIDIGLPLLDGSPNQPSKLSTLLIASGYALGGGSLRKTLA